MLSQFISKFSARTKSASHSKSAARSSFRGRFEQLETRAMLSATIGPTPQMAETNNFPISPSEIQILSLTSSIIASPENGTPLGQDPEAMLSHDVPPLQRMQQQPDPSTHIDSRAPEDGWGGDPRMLPPVVHTEMIFFASSSTAAKVQYNAEAFGSETSMHEIAKAGSGFAIWDISIDTELPPPNYKLVSDKSSGAVNHGDLGAKNYSIQDQHDKPFVYIESDKGPPLFSSDLDSYVPPQLPPTFGQIGSTVEASQRNSDVVFQLYFALPTSISESSLGGQPSDLSLAGSRSESDADQGGFIELDGSTTSSVSRSTETGNETIDAVLTEMYGFDLSAKGESNGDGSDHSAADAAAGDEQAMIFADAAEQGGMVALRSADTNRELIASTPVVDGPVNLSVPDSNIHMEAAVGIYQAFDVATGELPLTGKVVPAAVVVPAKKQEHDAKGNVSADKLVKPTMDQASAWVEMLTAAAVVRASKKERKAQTKV
jgi:hypothetical protein